MPTAQGMAGSVLRPFAANSAVRHHAGLLGYGRGAGTVHVAVALGASVRAFGQDLLQGGPVVRRPRVGEAAMLCGLALKWRRRNRWRAEGQSPERPNLVCGPVRVRWEEFARYFDVELRQLPMEPGACFRGKSVQKRSRGGHGFLQPSSTRVPRGGRRPEGP